MLLEVPHPGAMTKESRMDQARTSPKNMIVALLAAAALAVAGWAATSGPNALSSDHAGKPTKASGWR
jgi:hypothetical protein